LTMCVYVCVDRWLTAYGLLSGGEGLTQGKGKWETEPHDKRPDLPLWGYSENSQTIKAPWVCLVHTHTHTHTLKNPPHAKCVLWIAYACVHGVTSLQSNILGILDTKFQFSKSDSDPKKTRKPMEAFFIDAR